MNLRPILLVTAAAAGIGAAGGVGLWVARLSLGLTGSARVEVAAVPATAPPVRSADPAALPKIDLDVAKLSFGSRFDDEEPELSLGIRSAGAGVLHVERIETSCGCTRVGEVPKEVLPGATADVKIRVRLAGMSGPFSRAISVVSDDPAKPAARALIQGEVRPRLTAEPPRVTLEPATADAGASSEFDVTSGDGEPLTGLLATSAQPALKVTATVGEKSARVRVETGPFAEDFLGSVVLRRGKYERILAVTAVAARDVRASPERLNAGVVRGAQTLSVRLVARQGLSWRVVSVDTNRKDLTAEFADGMLRVRIDETAPAGAFVGHVTVNLEGAKPDKLRVPVTAFVER